MLVVIRLSARTLPLSPVQVYNGLVRQLVAEGDMDSVNQVRGGMANSF